jgi:hypothetical protein
MPLPDPPQLYRRSEIFSLDLILTIEWFSGEERMKKTIVFVALISLFLVPALPARGTTIKRVVPDPDPDKGKILVWGSVSFTDDMAIKRKYLYAHIHLEKYGSESPLTGVIVRLQDTALIDQGDGSYKGTVFTPTCGLGDPVHLSVDFSRIPLSRIGDSPYRGRMKLATYRIENTIEWIFPTHNQVIDLSAYPSGVPVRWNFTGPLAHAYMLIKILGAPLVYSADVLGAELTIPAGTLQPRHLYIFQMIDENYKFVVDSAFSPRSSIRFGLDSVINVRTQAAK